MQNKPQMMVCYLCGQQFGSSSLAIHQPQCYQKQVGWWKNGDPATRGPKPKDPAVHGHKSQSKMSAGQVQEFNEKNFEDFNQNLSACPNCGRTFLADRLAVHLRSCSTSASGGGSKPVSGKDPVPQASSPPPTSRPTSQSGRPVGVKPQFLVCSLCGQQFGSKSLGIHIPQCYEKKMLQWKSGDPATRGPKPKDPATTQVSAPSDLYSVDDFNKEQFEQYNSNLSRCPNCSRTFLPDRLQVHLRSCNPNASGGGSKPAPGGGPVGSPESKPHASSKSQKEQGARPNMLVCYLCGNQFGTASLTIHQAQCYVKQLTWWERADPATRGPKPKDPAKHGPSTADLASCDKDAFNNDQFADYKDNLSACPNCGRTFLADRLQVHLRSCKGGGVGSKPSPARPNSRSQSPIQSEATTPRLGNGQQSPPPTAQQPHLHQHRRTSVGSGPHSPGHKRSPLLNRLPDAPTPARHCEHCSTVEHDADAKFCQECGGRLPDDDAPPLLRCTACGEGFDSGAFCQTCGGGLEAVARSPPPPPEEEPRAKPVFCSNCGHSMTGGTKFCEDCGQQQQEPQQPQSGGKRCPLTNRAPSKAASPQEGSDGTSYNSGSTANNDSPVSNGECKPTQKQWPAEDAPNKLPAVHKGADTAHQDNPDSHDDEPGIVDEEETVNAARTPCAHCGRQFAVDRLEKHQKACGGMRKRRVFNSTSARVSGTEAATYQQDKPKGGGGGLSVPKADWKSKSSSFRDAMKAAREVDMAIKSGAPLPPPTYTKDEDDTRVPCPSCQRNGPPTSPLPQDVARMGITPEKWDKIQKKRDEEWQQAFGEAPTDLHECPNCSRRFVPKSLEIHLRSCGGVHGTSKKLKR
eukprot:gene14590-22316_t